MARQLNDVRAADGGFVICPGSHKATYTIPEGVMWCRDMSTVRHVPVDAGDVLLFLGSAVTHGALPWRSETPRRAAILSYCSKYSALYSSAMTRQSAAL